MDENDYPSDIDQDRICDLLDSSDDRSIILVYLSNNLELANNSQMDPLIPITAGGDISTWEIYPALPLGLDFSGNMPSRSTTFTGIITGTPTETTQTTTYTIWANNTNSGQSGTFQVTIRVLTDLDGDAIPDIYDDDADDDGWSNEMETLCAHDPLDADSVPINSDTDPFCDYIDDDDDGDSFIDTEEIMCNTDSKDNSSIPIDANNNGICDVNEDDQDFDGWADGNEEACGTDPNDASDVPDDLDGDKECDLWDEDDDGDNVGDNVDDFPRDSSASKDTDGDGMPDTITGTSSTGLVEDNDDDDDNWNDTLELDCGTNPLDEDEFPVDADNSGTCDAMELDTDGDGYMDSEDAFPDDSSEWLDTDGDTIGDNADDDDDGDSWIDSEEERCGSDPLDVDDVPNDSDQDGVCEAVKTNQNQESSDETSSITTWLFCLPCLLILLLIPLAWLAKERGDSIMVIMGMRNGPEPENTTSNPRFLTGKGTKVDPYVLKPAHVKNFGDDIESEETITITNLDPDTLVTITDMSAHTNRGRFNMDPIHVEGDRELKGTGSIVFQAKFDDNVTEDDVSGVYDGLIRIGSSSVYLSWEVTVGDPVGDAKKKQKAEEEAKKAEEARLKAEKDAEVKAAKETEAKLKKERKAEKEAADKKAKEEAESKAKAEKEAADKKAKEEAEKEAADKAKEEAESKAKAEKEATEKKLKEAEEKAAAAEAKAKAAEEKAASEKKARENAEDEARAAAEEAAKERLAQMDKEMEERRAKLEEMDEKTRKKEEELLRISEKAKNIDFTTLGVAARSKVSKPVEKGAKEISMGDTSSFDESGNAWVQDDEGGMNISWTGKTATALTGVKGLKRGFAAAATVTASDDLQRIKGVGPFIEDKLNALGIYTFDQVGNMTPEIEEEVNIAIEFFPGRVKRDEWAKQARKFAKK